MKYATVTGGQTGILISYVVSKVVRCANTVKHRTGHPSYPPALPYHQTLPVGYGDLVEYKSLSEVHRFILSVIDHLTRFAILIPIKNKEATTVVRNLVARVFSVFGVPEILHSDQGKEFDNQVVTELQSVFGYKKIRTAAYRPQGNSVLERMHSTVHKMLAIYSNLACNNWAAMLLFLQLAHNSASTKTLAEAPHHLTFSRAAKLPVELILGVPTTAEPQSRLNYSHRTVENLHLAYELARCNLNERTDKQAVGTEELYFLILKPGDQVLIHRPYNETDELNSLRHRSYTVRACLSPVTYRVPKDNEPAETNSCPSWSSKEKLYPRVVLCPRPRYAQHVLRNNTPDLRPQRFPHESHNWSIHCVLH